MKHNIPKIAELTVKGMTCSNCALGIKKALEKEGVSNVSVDFASGTVRFEKDEQIDNENIIKARIESLGYRVQSSGDDKLRTPFGLGIMELKFWVSAFFTIPLVLAMFLPFMLLHNSYFQLALTIPVYLIGIAHFGRSAFKSIRAGIANMDLLIFLGSSAAFVYSLMGTIRNYGHDYMFYETAASIITIVLLGNLLEQRAVKKTTSAVGDLLRLQKNIAKRIIKKGLIEHIEEIDSSEILIGDLVIVNSGDKIPVDGEIYWGSGSADESMLTGESIPVEKSVKSNVIGGTLLLSGTIKVKTTAVGEGTVLSQIIEMVKTAQQEKPKLQNLADRISAVFVPTVVLLAILTLFGTLAFTDSTFREALMRSIAVLLIACPCALGLAIPTAVMVGLGRMAKSGILIKKGSSIEKLAACDTIVFDKTGTLTTGKFTVKEIRTFSKSKQEVMGIISAMEKHSNHPLAEALLLYCGNHNVPDLQEVYEDKGIGLYAKGVDGQEYHLGSYSVASHLTSDNSHNIYLVVNGTLVAWIDIEDEIKSEANGTIKFLKDKGMQTVLLSGDSLKRCNEVASALGINDVYAEVLPKDKFLKVKVLSENGRVVMVGDGINDAPALARADVGISMSNATQIAVKSADIVILRGDLNLIPQAMGISKATIKTIKENLFWAFFYNVAAIPLAILGYLTPIVAAGAMMASSIMVVLNSIRLKGRRVY